MGQAPCLLAEFTRIRDEWHDCVIDPSMGGTGSTGGHTNQQTDNCPAGQVCCPRMVTAPWVDLYH